MPRRRKFVEGRGYSREDWDEVCNNPPITADWVAAARPFAEVFPELAATIKKRGKQRAPTKELVTLRVDRDTLAAFKALGRGWQTRMNVALKDAAKGLAAPRKEKELSADDTDGRR
jgi:uncharacterized protein (DUF4415 family)